MKVKDLPENTSLATIKVRLPKKTLVEYKAYCGGEEQMYIVGSMMGDFFLSPVSPETKGEKKLYPMPPSVVPQDILEWEVVA